MSIEPTTPSVQSIYDADDALGEAILWCDRTQSLFWVDVPAGTVKSFNPETNEARSFKICEPVGFLALAWDGSILAGAKSGLMRIDADSGEISHLCDLDADDCRRPNDSSVSRDGRLIFGTMPLNAETGEGRLFRMDPGCGQLALLVNELRRPNGLAFSPDNKWMYLSDSHPQSRKIWRFQYDACTGSITDRTMFFDTAGLPGRPDGATVDRAANYWVAGVEGGEIMQISPGGELMKRVRLPVTHPTKLCFGGPRLDQIFISTMGKPRSDSEWGGQILKIDLGVIGLPEPRFRFESVSVAT